MFSTITNVYGDDKSQVLTTYHDGSITNAATTHVYAIPAVTRNDYAMHKAESIAYEEPIQKYIYTTDQSQIPVTYRLPDNQSSQTAVSFNIINPAEPLNVDADVPVPKKRPRKQKPKKVIKKRDRNPDGWKRNVRKKLKNLGQEYVSSTGKIIEKKHVKPACGEKCRVQCSKKITPEQRQTLFDAFWNLGDVTKQRDYIVDLVGIIKPKYRYAKEQSKRSLNFSFHFNIPRKNSAIDDRIRVCKTFFTATLDIGDTMMRTAMKKFNQEKSTADKRGKHANHRKVDQATVDDMKQHIEGWLPHIGTNYIRKDHQITIPKLYKDYVAQSKAENRKIGKLHLYRHVFHTDFKFYAHWFFPVFKNQCRVCHIFENLSQDERRFLMMEFSRHSTEGHWNETEPKQAK